MFQSRFSRILTSTRLSCTEAEAESLAFQCQRDPQAICSPRTAFYPFGLLLSPLGYQEVHILGMVESPKCCSWQHDVRVPVRRPRLHATLGAAAALVHTGPGSTHVDASGQKTIGGAFSTGMKIAGEWRSGKRFRAIQPSQDFILQYQTTSCSVRSIIPLSSIMRCVSSPNPSPTSCRFSSCL